MLGSLSEFTVRLAELSEAEGRVLRHHLMVVVQRLLLWSVAALLLAVGLLTLAAGVCWALALAIGWPAALMIGALGLLISAGLLVVFAHTRQQPPR